MPSTITEATFNDAVAASKKERKEKQAEEESHQTLEYTHSEVDRHLKNKDYDKAQAELDKHQGKVRVDNSGINFKEFFRTETEEEHKEDILKIPEGLNSGYEINGKDLLIPYGALSIFAAKTGHGKTTLLNNLAVNFVKENKDMRVWMFGYEMTSGDMKKNIMSAYIGQYIKEGQSLHPNHPELRTAIKRYLRSPNSDLFDEETKLFLDKHYKTYMELIKNDRLVIKWGTWTTDDLITLIQKIHTEYTDKQNIIIVDYIQLLRSETREKRHEEIKAICGSLMQTATKLECPIILGAQFNRDGKLPCTLQLEDLGEGGDIERSASLVVAFFNNNKLAWDDNGSLANNKKNNEIDENFKRTYIQHKDTLYVEVLKNRGENKQKGIWKFDESTGVIRDNSDTKQNTSKSNNTETTPNLDKLAPTQH